MRHYGCVRHRSDDVEVLVPLARAFLVICESVIEQQQYLYGVLFTEMKKDAGILREM